MQDAQSAGTQARHIIRTGNRISLLLTIVPEDLVDELDTEYGERLDAALGDDLVAARHVSFCLSGLHGCEAHDNENVIDFVQAAEHRCTHANEQEKSHIDECVELIRLADRIRDGALFHAMLFRTPAEDLRAMLQPRRMMLRSVMGKRPILYIPPPHWVQAECALLGMQSEFELTQLRIAYADVCIAHSIRRTGAAFPADVGERYMKFRAEEYEALGISLASELAELRALARAEEISVEDELAAPIPTTPLHEVGAE